MFVKEFKEKVVVITGGNSGIGRAIATHFNKNGAKIAIFGRHEASLKQTSGTLQQSIYVQGDVKKHSDLQNLFTQTEQTFGKVDILIANAGIVKKCHVADANESLFDEIVDTNYKGVFFTVQTSLPHIKDGASIVLISSIAPLIGTYHSSIYASSKAAVTCLAKNFSADLLDRNIRVNSLSPGYTQTPILTKGRNVTDTILHQKRAQIPAKRFAEPEEIAKAAAFLCSEGASYIVGSDLVIDGGVSNIHPIRNET